MMKRSLVERGDMWCIRCIGVGRTIGSGVACPTQSSLQARSVVERKM